MTKLSSKRWNPRSKNTKAHFLVAFCLCVKESPCKSIQMKSVLPSDSFSCKSNSFSTIRLKMTRKTRFEKRHRLTQKWPTDNGKLARRENIWLCNKLVPNEALSRSLRLSLIKYKDAAAICNHLLSVKPSNSCILTFPWTLSNTFLRDSLVAFSV